uniref:Uncharacterized protein n=1 Tax=Ananas comosus var. bracteatus TaxID=296719 RepID=A0A6V7PF26_ANACO|nr:unnamed protein product [Ananas comosus var. bracteatus]
MRTLTLACLFSLSCSPSSLHHLPAVRRTHHDRLRPPPAAGIGPSSLSTTIFITTFTFFCPSISLEGRTLLGPRPALPLVLASPPPWAPRLPSSGLRRPSAVVLGTPTAAGCSCTAETRAEPMRARDDPAPLLPPCAAGKRERCLPWVGRTRQPPVPPPTELPVGRIWVELSSSCFGYASLPAAVAASHRRPTRARAPFDCPQPPPVGAPAVRRPPATLGLQRASFADFCIASALSTVVGHTPNREHGLRHVETYQ